MPALQAGLAIAGLGGQVFSHLLGARQNRAAQNLLNKQLEDNESFYNRNVNRDFLETNAAKGIFEQLRKQLQESNKLTESKAAVTGATPEAEIAAKSRTQENYNDAVNQLGQQATGYQQNQEAIFRGEKARLTDQQIALHQQKAENASNVAANAGDLISSAAALTPNNTPQPVTGNAVINARTPEMNQALKDIQNIKVNGYFSKSPFRVD